MNALYWRRRYLVVRPWIMDCLTAILLIAIIVSAMAALGVVGEVVR